MEVKEGCSDQSRERGRGAEELDLDRPGSELGKTPGPCLPVSAAAGSGSPGLLEGGRERERVAAAAVGVVGVLWRWGGKTRKVAKPAPL